MAVYDKNIDLGTTEFNLTTTEYNGIEVQELSICGTNEPFSWRWSKLKMWLKEWRINCDLRSRHGIKIGPWRAAKEIFNSTKYLTERIIHLPLIIDGHSKGADEALAFKRRYYNTNSKVFCIAFAPAPMFRRIFGDRKMYNTAVIIDPDDPVPKLGVINFGHPEFLIIKTKNDHIGLNKDDHDLSNYKTFIDGTEDA